MPTGTTWTDETYREALTAVHGRWKEQEGSDGALPRRAFCVRYLVESGLGSPTFRYRRHGRFDALLASCPPEVRDDFQSLAVREWTPDLIIAALKELFVSWQQVAQAKTTTLRWSPSYLRTTKPGARILRSLRDARVPVEVYLFRIGGPILNEWRHRRRWTRDELRDELRRARRVWLSDGHSGKPAGKRFNVAYLHGHHYRLLRGIGSRFPGGVQAFVRTLPDIKRDWSRRVFRTDADIRDDLCKLHYQWLRDEQGREAGYPFGPTYLRLKGRKDLAHAMERRGKRRIFRGHEQAPAALMWGARLPGMQRSDLRKLRRVYRKRVGLRVRRNRHV